MSLELITPPAIEPVDLATARLHLRLDADGSPASHPDDDLVTGHIVAARTLVEEYTARRLITQTLRLNLDLFPTDIQLPAAPVQAISSVTYVDSDGVTQTLATDQYVLDAASTPPWLLIAVDQTWPATQSVANAVHVTFTAGYGDDAADVPMPLRSAMLLLVGELYANREPQAGDEASLPPVVRRLLAPYRIWLP